jgi:hypothetical protein
LSVVDVVAHAEPKHELDLRFADGRFHAVHFVQGKGDWF